MCARHVQGGDLRAGNATSPFTKKATIKLNGDKASLPLQLDESIDTGPKVLAVLGKLRLFGQRRPTVWTRLSKTANAGATEISVVDSVDWQVRTGSASNHRQAAEYASALRRFFGFYAMYTKRKTIFKMK